MPGSRYEVVQLSRRVQATSMNPLRGQSTKYAGKYHNVETSPDGVLDNRVRITTETLGTALRAVRQSCHSPWEQVARSRSFPSRQTTGFRDKRA